MSWTDKFRVDLPEGESGDWRISRFTVDEDAARWDAIRSGARAVRPGTYTALRYKGTVIMSDTLAEIRDHYAAVYAACGHCLVTGLGLGMVVQAMLSKDDVDRVTVIEKSPDVIALVAPTLRARYGDRIEIIEADAYEWKPPKGVRYGAVWHDIWPNICADNLDGMATLKRRFARRSDWQGAWAQDQCRRQRREWCR